MMAMHPNKNNTGNNIRKLIHDIKSPLSCLQMIAICSEKTIAEEKQNLLRLIDRIINIADSFNPMRQSAINVENQLDLVEVIDNILLEKKTEYHNSIISYNKPHNLSTLKIKGLKSDVERMLSNIINNAIESVSNKLPMINIKLEINHDMVNLHIEDNGKGIPQDILDQINNGVSVTFGKANGQGLGFIQIREAINKCNGKLAIQSSVGIGTRLTLSFKKETA